MNNMRALNAVFCFAKSFVFIEIYVFDLIASSVLVPVKRASKDMCLLPFVPSISNAFPFLPQKMR